MPIKVVAIYPLAPPTRSFMPRAPPLERLVRLRVRVRVGVRVRARVSVRVGVGIRVRVCVPFSAPG